METVRMQEHRRLWRESLPGQVWSYLIGQIHCHLYVYEFRNWQEYSGTVRRNSRLRNRCR